MKKSIYYTIIFILIIILLFTRFYNLTAKPLHHDEGVNGWFMNNLFYDGNYKYDPSNYHGPFFYFMTLPAFFLFGSTILGLRITIALFGIALFFLIFALKEKFSKLAFIFVLIFFILSPSISYYSRYAIHETLFIFFTLAFYISLIQYLNKKNPDYLYLAAASLGFLFAIKETAYIAAFIFFTYFFISDIYSYTAKRHFTYFNLLKKNLKHFLIAFLIFIGILVVFYSNFFHNISGSFDIIKSLYYWFATGTGASESGHVKSFFYFAWLLIRYEFPILIFGIVGIIYFIKSRKNSLLVWWTILTFLIYSLIPYKTPWLLPNMVLPLILLSGYGIQFIYKKENLRKMLFVLLFLSIIFLACNMVWVNFVYSTVDDKNNFAYAHTTADIFWIMKTIEDSGYNKVGMVGNNGESYWPLPFYLQNYDILYGEPLFFKNLTDRDILIMYVEIKKQLPSQHLEDLKFYTEYDFQLRPNVGTKLYVKNNKT